MELVKFQGAGQEYLEVTSVKHVSYIWIINALHRYTCPLQEVTGFLRP
jgi:hypothetical protein